MTTNAMTPSRSTSFRYERELTKPVTNWLRSQQLVVRSEFPTPWGICDLVGAKLDEKRVRQRLDLGQRRTIGSFCRVAILMSLPDLETNSVAYLPEIQERYANLLRAEMVEKELRVLCANGFAKCEGDGFQKVNGWMPLHRRLVAVELKLSRFGDAFDQARNNREFASESYIALPLDATKRIVDRNKHNELREAGVGLLGVTCNSCEILVASPESPNVTNPVCQAHCVERFWRKT
jgi:hypothetical protein